MTNLNVALTFDRSSFSQRVRLVYTNRFNETRVVSHLTHDDASIRAVALSRRGYRVKIETMEY